MHALGYQILVEWNDEADCYLVGLPDFPGQRWRTHGDTYREAVANGKEVLQAIVDAYHVTGRALPLMSFWRFLDWSPEPSECC